MRKRIYQILEGTEERDIPAGIYNIIMIAAIIVSLVPLCARSEEPWTDVIDYVTVGIFIIDYLLRFLTADLKDPENDQLAFFLYPLSPMAVIDLLAMLPTFGILSYSLRVLKVVRLFRTVRVLRALRVFHTMRSLRVQRYSRSVTMIAEVIRSQKEALVTVAALAVVYILISAMVIFDVEPDTFSDYFDAVYWACVSLMTIGYGDLYPVTVAGKLVTMISSAVGIAIVALPAGIITAGYMTALQEEKKKTREAEEKAENEDKDGQNTP